MKRSRWLGLALVALAAAGCGTSSGADGGTSGSGSGTNGAGGASGSSGGIVQPSVRSVDPATGPTDGGIAIRILGSGFLAGASARIGANPVAGAAVVSPGELDGTLPPGSAGQADVVVINPDTRLGKLANGFTYVAPSQGPSIGFCNLQFPLAAMVQVGTPFTLFGRVYAQGVTEGAGQGAGIQMQAGLGFADGGLTWADAGYNKDVPSSPGASDLNNDEYAWSSRGPEVGAYSTAFRARLLGGAWKYCEKDGMHDAIDPSQLGSLIAVAPAPPQVSWCNLQFPTAASGAQGAPLSLYGQVYQAGVTDKAGQGSGISMQAGIGFSDGGWSWHAAGYDGDRGPTGNPTANDEYQWNGTNPTQIGSYFTAFRAQLDGGPWTYCLTNGPADQIDTSEAGTLEVIAAAPPVVSWCNLQFPTEQQTVPDAGITVYGRVFQPGVTNRPDAGPGIAMQLGIASSDGGFSWQDATYNVDVSSFPNSGDINNDEYKASFHAPGIGNYEMSYRASLDGGPWTYCEVDGPHADYVPLSAAPLTVGSTVGWCNLQFPQYPPDSLLDAGSAANFYGRVYQRGVTDQVGQGPGIQMQFGYGPGDGGFVWSATRYNVDVDGTTPGDHANDEYVAQTTVPVAGTYRTLFRAQLDGGPWLYCEPSGPSLGVRIADAGVLISH